MLLQRHQKHLQIALNSTLEEAKSIILQLPQSERILIEVGTPLIKIYGTKAVLGIREAVSSETYIVADSKCADLARREVKLFAQNGANAITCLGNAPVETIDQFIQECKRFRVDSMIDMMNVENPLLILRKLKTPPNVVILHRGVDETENKEKQIPYYQIKQIKGNYNKVLVSVAGGDTIKEVRSAVFNDADIVVVWKSFFQSSKDTTSLAEQFLKEVR